MSQASIALMSLLFFPSIGFGDNTASMTRYYHYDGKPIFLRKTSFRRYVIPQLTSMSKDYERLLQKIHPLHEKLVAIRRQGDNLWRTWEKTRFFCHNRFFQECQEGVRKAYAVGRKVDLFGLNFWSQHTNFYPIDKNVEPGRMMALFVDLGEILGVNYLILHYLEEALLPRKFGQNRHARLAKKVDLLFKDLEFFSNKAMTGLLSEQEKKMFDFVWDNFLSPLDTYVVKGRDKEYLLRHLEDLNIAWHTFHMKMTKGFRKYPPHTEVFLTIMSKRWNSILKIILHTKGE